MSTHELSNDGNERAPSPPSPANMENNSEEAETPQLGAAASAPRATQPPKTFFGMAHDSQKQNSRPNAFKDDYVAQFPVDPYGQETAPNARVWRVYVEEAAAYDENMVGQSRDGLDVMLVFAGLFSAVVTSFLVQVSQNLQADFSEMSALLLHDLLVVQLSMADGATVNVTTPSVDPAAKFDPDAIDVWINGLWVVSLTTSLVVALAAVLVKQWLHRYMTFRSGTPELRSHIRHYRFIGLETWRVRIIIGMLPIIMHISLMLFFAGLVLFYIPLRASLAWTVGTLTVLVCILYLVSNTIPIIYPQCPYQTPLTDFIHHLCQVVPFGIRSIQHYCFMTYRGIRKRLVLSSTASESESESESDLMAHSNFRLLTQLEFDAVRDAHDTLSVDALDWLYQMSSNPTVHTLVLQGISGLPADSRSHAIKKWSDATEMRSRRLELLRESLPSGDSDPVQPWVLERLCRSSLFLTMGHEPVEGEIPLKKAAEWDPSLEAAIVLAFRLQTYDYIGFFISHSEVLMHPLVWEHISLRVIGYLYPSFMLAIHGDLNGSFLAQFLSSVIVPPPAISPSASLMTGRQTIWTRLHPQFWDTILNAATHLNRFDIVTPMLGSSYLRILIAAGRLALSRIRQYRHDMDNSTIAFEQLLAQVVRAIGEEHNFVWTVDFDFLISVLKEFRDGSSSIEPNSPLSLDLDSIPSYYHQSSSQPDFHFPDLDYLLQTWAGLYNCTQYDPVFTLNRHSDLKTPITVMTHALSRGHEEAYRIFVNRGWMTIIFTEWALCGDEECTIYQLIKAYIQGLYTLTLDSNRREFCKYLHQPQQLILALKLIVATTPSVCSGLDSWFVPGLDVVVVQLFKICPTHASWRACVTALEGIHKWCQITDSELSLFPWSPSLQRLADTEAFRKYPLVEWTARRFADAYKQRKMKIALYTVFKAVHKILDNAEHVNGILMPDLEDPLAVDAAAAPPSEGVCVVSDGD